jgi:ADP-heptose:LPS heptosyltransferase
LETPNNPLPKNILVIRLSAMGDVAMTIPVLKSLENQYPGVKLTVLSRPFFEPIFNDLPNVNFIAVDLNSKHKGLLGIFSLFFGLRKYKFDAVADLHGVLRSHLLRSLFRLSGKQGAQIDKGRAEKKALTRTESKVFKQLKTTPERYTDVFRELGFDLILEPIEKRDKPTNPQTRIGIAPFAQHAAKEYPLELMEKVVEMLLVKYEVFLFGGGEKEKIVLDGWAAQYKSVTSTVGKQSFAEELKLIPTLDLIISMDSGNGHLAANFGVTVLTIWGLTHPYAGFAPYGSSEINWLLPELQKYPNIPTSIYGNNMPQGYESAIESITPEMVLEKVEELLKL